MIKSIIKRDGRKVPFNLQKIADAIFFLTEKTPFVNFAILKVIIV